METSSKVQIPRLSGWMSVSAPTPPMSGQHLEREKKACSVKRHPSQAELQTAMAIRPAHAWIRNQWKWSAAESLLRKSDRLVRVRPKILPSPATYHDVSNAMLLLSISTGQREP